MTKCDICGFQTGNQVEWTFEGLKICSACHEDLLTLGVSPQAFTKIPCLRCRPVMHHTPPKWLLVPCSDYEVKEPEGHG
jgi:hypothetical protein